MISRREEREEMKLSTVFRRAARALDKEPAGIYSCMCGAVESAGWASGVGWGGVCDALERLDKTFANDALKVRGHPRYWGANWGKQSARQKPENYDFEEAKRCRVLALLFLAAMAESDGN